MNLRKIIRETLKEKKDLDASSKEEKERSDNSFDPQFDYDKEDVIGILRQGLKELEGKVLSRYPDAEEDMLDLFESLKEILEYKGF